MGDHHSWSIPIQGIERVCADRRRPCIRASTRLESISICAAITATRSGSTPTTYKGLAIGAGLASICTTEEQARRTHNALSFKEVVGEVPGTSIHDLPPRQPHAKAQ